MGEVYRARDTRLDRTVAVKIVPARLSAVPGLSERLEREARAISAIDHRHVWGLYDVRADNGVDFIVMQFDRGATLAERLQSGPIPVEEAIGLARQVASGLESAHERGILHRDLKPSNLKITRDGEIKILDIGLAEAFTDGPYASEPAQSPTLTARATALGVVLGTAACMSPEPLPIEPFSPPWGDISSDGRIIYRASATTGEVVDLRTNTRQAVENLVGDPLWAPTGSPSRSPFASLGPHSRRLTSGCGYRRPPASGRKPFKDGLSGSCGTGTASCWFSRENRT
jgi:serine/threonine protein kinase